MYVSFALDTFTTITTNPFLLTSYGTVTAGDVLLIQFSFASTAVSITGITDSRPNTWVLASAVDVGTTRFETWWVASAIAGTTQPTVAFSGVPSARFYMYRVSNISSATLGPVNQLDAVAPVANTVTLAPVTMVSGGVVFTNVRYTTAAVSHDRWEGFFTDTENFVSSGNTDRAGHRTEIIGFSAAPVEKVAGSTTSGRSHTVGIYGTSTVTRLYPSEAYPGQLMRGPLRGTWAMGADVHEVWAPNQVMNELVTTKTNAGSRAPFYLVTNQQGDFDFEVTKLITPPLEATTLAGTLQLCFQAQSYWDSGAGITMDSIARLKIFAYISVGSTTEVRQILIDNHIESANIYQSTFNWQWIGLASALAVAGSIFDGDRIMIEIGVRLVSSPTPVPTYPPSAYSKIELFILGSGTSARLEPMPDAAIGEVSYNKSSWIEFSHPLVYKTPTPPANDACADAIVISSLPYQSDFIDSTGSLGSNREVWWTWTAPSDGFVMGNTLGSNYLTTMTVYTGSCGSLITGGIDTSWSDSDFMGLRNLAYTSFTAVAGTQYWIRVYQGSVGARDHGGTVRFAMFYQDIIPQENDVYLNAGWLAGFRDGQMFNFDPFFIGYGTSGVAIDYSERPLYPLYDDEIIHTDHRILVTMHGSELVELLDLATLNFETSEIDYFYNFDGQHPARLYVTRDGFVYTSFFGNGYLYVLGAGDLPASLNTISNTAIYSSIQKMDVTQGESQPPDYSTPEPTTYLPAPEITAPWGFTIDEENEIVYYTSSGYYIPVGGQLIKRFNLATNTQMTDFATVTLQGAHNTGLKGIRLLPDGGLLVANGTEVTRLNSAGVTIQHYIPSNTEDHQRAMDIELTSDGTMFWMYDSVSTRLTKFNLSTGAELFSFQPYLQIGASTQIAVYHPEGVVVPPPDISGIYFINPDKTTNHDSYYNDVENKIPDPTIRTPLLGE